MLEVIYQWVMETTVLTVLVAMVIIVVDPDIEGAEIPLHSLSSFLYS